jgi:Tfp pilus assembly protein PilP
MMGRWSPTTRAACLAAMLAVAGTAVAQQPPATPPGPQKPDPQKPADVYSYNPEGRRDPFVSLLFRGTEMRPTRENRAEGLPGLMINEISIRGIVRSRDGFVAMLSGPDNKTYIVHTNDKLLDGSVKAITADSVIFSQDVNDPLSLVKQREVRKYLRVSQEGK